MIDYEIGVSHLPTSSFDLTNENTILRLTSLGEIALKAYKVDAGNDLPAALKENLIIDIDKVNTVVEIRKPGKGRELGEPIGYISGNAFVRKLPEDNLLGKSELKLFRIHGAAVLPEMQSHGAGQLLLNEALDMLNVDVLIGETNNPQAVLSRVKAAERSGKDWTVVWGNEKHIVGQEAPKDKLEFVIAHLYQETIDQRAQDSQDPETVSLDMELFKKTHIINAPDFVTDNKIDKSLLKALPKPLQGTYLEMGNLSEKSKGVSFQAPIYSINHNLFE